MISRNRFLVDSVYCALPFKLRVSNWRIIQHHIRTALEVIPSWYGPIDADTNNENESDDPDKQGEGNEQPPQEPFVW